MDLMDVLIQTTELFTSFHPLVLHLELYALNNQPELLLVATIIYYLQKEGTLHQKGNENSSNVQRPHKIVKRFVFIILNEAL